MLENGNEKSSIKETYESCQKTKVNFKKLRWKWRNTFYFPHQLLGHWKYFLVLYVHSVMSFTVLFAICHNLFFNRKGIVVNTRSLQLFLSDWSLLFVFSYFIFYNVLGVSFSLWSQKINQQRVWAGLTSIIVQTRYQDGH